MARQKNWKMHQHISGIIDACEKDKKKAAMLLVCDGENVMAEVHGNGLALSCTIGTCYRGLTEEHRKVILTSLVAYTTKEGFLMKLRLKMKYKLLKWLLRCKTEQE